MGIWNIGPPAGVSTKIGRHEYFWGKKNGKNREYRNFSESCLTTLKACIFVPESSPRRQMDVLTTESFLYFDIIFFICYGYLTKIWSASQNIRYFLILLKDFLNNAKMWKSNTDFDLAPESEIMVQMSSDQGRWHLRSLNNFSINMVYP